MGFSRWYLYGWAWVRLDGQRVGVGVVADGEEFVKSRDSGA